QIAQIARRTESWRRRRSFCSSRLLLEPAMKSARRCPRWTCGSRNREWNSAWYTLRGLFRSKSHSVWGSPSTSFSSSSSSERDRTVHVRARLSVSTVGRSAADFSATIMLWDCG
ncbi:unnamed protein product, partial [Mycena citricolor]